MGNRRAMAHHNHGSQMLTANRLRDGDVLYRKGDGWVLRLAEGDVYADPAAADAALAAPQQNVTAQRVRRRPICSRCATRTARSAGEGARDHPRRRPHRASRIPASRRAMTP